jgi:hypothetical protein
LTANQSTPLDTLAFIVTGLPRGGADQLLGHVQVPLFGQRGDAVRPELNRPLSLGDERSAALVGNQPQVEQPLNGVLLGGDVGPDAGGALLTFSRGQHDHRR